jgi:thiaminase
MKRYNNSLGKSQEAISTVGHDPVCQVVTAHLTLDELRSSHWSHVVADLVCATQWLVARVADEMKAKSAVI